MSNENYPRLKNITKAREFFSSKEGQEIPLGVIWKAIENISADTVESKQDGDWFVSVGLEVVRALRHMDPLISNLIGFDVMDVAQKTDKVHKKFYP